MNVAGVSLSEDIPECVSVVMPAGLAIRVPVARAKGEK